MNKCHQECVKKYVFKRLVGVYGGSVHAGHTRSSSDEK
jgi:hypothetical protein